MPGSTSMEMVPAASASSGTGESVPLDAGLAMPVGESLPRGVGVASMSATEHATNAARARFAREWGDPAAILFLGVCRKTIKF